MKPIYAHPLDPSGHYRHATHWGECVARREMSEDLAFRYCNVLSRFDGQMQPTEWEPPYDPANDLGVRLCNWMRESQTIYAERTTRADKDIRNAIRPLFVKEASTAAIEEAAGAANANVLNWDDIFSILRDELIAYRRFGRRRA